MHGSWGSAPVCSSRLDALRSNLRLSLSHLPSQGTPPSSYFSIPTGGEGATVRETVLVLTAGAELCETNSAGRVRRREVSQ